MPQIFVIDDDNDLLKVVKTILKRQAFVVSTFNDWKVAKDAMVKTNPDLILLDVFLHGSDGLNVCQRFKASPYTKHIPILLFSGFPRIAATAIEDYGAEDFLGKPFEVNELINKVHAILAKKGVST
jgi:DNA-binding response OmpR family regulator